MFTAAPRSAQTYYLMSAIVGRINLDGSPVEASAFEQALNAVAQYGRDGNASRSDGNAALGIQRHNLSDKPAAEMDPARHGDILAVSDTILNNRAELLESLDISPDDPLTDTELLLRCYLKWGKDCATHIRGDFAFAIYDRAENRLFLFRDHIGIRHLFWARKGQTFLFATDIRAIIAWTDFSWPTNQAAVARHIMGPARPALETFYEGIHSLKPGRCLAVDQDGNSETRWWDPADLPKTRFASQDDYVAAFRDLMERIGDRYTATAGPIGTHMSGGIDSCSVAAFAAMSLKERGQSLAAGYTWAPPPSDRYPLKKVDERNNILQIAGDFGFPVRYGLASGETQHDYLSWPIEHQGIANLSDELPVLEQAKQDGLRVMLSGWGGDEAFSAHGMGYLAQAIKRGNLRNFLIGMRYYTRGMRKDWRVTLRSFTQWGLAPLMPDPIYRRLAPFVDLHEGGAFPSAATRANGGPPAPYQGEDVRMIADPNRYLVSLLKMGHLNMRMETWAAWSADYGFQYRYPLLDRELLEFVIGMPPSLFFGDRNSRFLARAVTQDILPRRLTKHDQANEVLRDDNRVACWHLLKQDLAHGVFDGHSDWLDLPALRATIAAPPASVEDMDMSALARMMAAVRVYHMEKRLG